MEQTNEISMLRINFNYRRGKVNIYLNNINALNCPRFVKFMFSPEKKLLFLCGIDKHELDCFTVPYEEDGALKKADKFELSGKAFVRKISTILEWDLDSTHIVAGTLDEEHRMIVFDLKNEVFEEEN